MDLATTTTSYGAVSDKRWIGSEATVAEPETVTLDLSLFPAGLYPLGSIPSGTPLAKHTTSGYYGPLVVTDEIQTLTVGGAGLTSFTITYSGQTTASIAAAATAATVQAALEALSNIAVGDVKVTGSAGGPWTLTFAGLLADTNVAEVTTTPTGGSGTVVVATTTAGGAETANLTALDGFLYEAEKVLNASGKAGVAIIREGRIREKYLPYTVDANGWADVANRIHRTVA